MKKLLLFIIIPFLSFGQNFSPKIDVGIKLQSEYFKDPTYNTISNYELNENIISHAFGFVFGVNMPSLNLKLGVEGLLKPRHHMRFGNTKDYSSFIGDYGFNEDGMPFVSGEHGDYTLSDKIEFSSPYEINLYFDYSLFKNFSLSLITYLSPKNTLSTQNQEWMPVVYYDLPSLSFIEENMVVSSFENFEWIESGMSFGLSYLIKNLKLDIRIPIVVSTSNITGSQTLNSFVMNNGRETTEISGHFQPKKGVVFSVAYLFSNLYMQKLEKKHLIK